MKGFTGLGTVILVSIERSLDTGPDLFFSTDGMDSFGFTVALSRAMLVE